MTYQRFSQLWDALVTNRPKASTAGNASEVGMSRETATALIEYGKGNKAKIDAVRTFLATHPA